MYLKDAGKGKKRKSGGAELEDMSTMPDTVILYQLHLECGRLINLYVDPDRICKQHQLLPTATNCYQLFCWCLVLT